MEDFNKKDGIIVSDYEFCDEVRDAVLQDAWMQSHMDILRDNIRYYRKEKNLTQQELADLSYCSRGAIIAAENHHALKGITVTLLLSIAYALKINVGDLFMVREDNNCVKEDKKA